MVKILNFSSLSCYDLFCMMMSEIFIPLCFSLPASQCRQLHFCCSQAYKFPVRTGNFKYERYIIVLKEATGQFLIENGVRLAVNGLGFLFKKHCFRIYSTTNI